MQLTLLFTSFFYIYNENQNYLLLQLFIKLLIDIPQLQVALDLILYE